MTTKVFKDSNRTTAFPFEKMTLVVTKKDSGGVRLRLIQHGITNELPGAKTDFFLDASETAELTDLLRGSRAGRAFQKDLIYGEETIALDYAIDEDGAIFVSMDGLVSSMEGYVAKYRNDAHLDANTMVYLLSFIKHRIENDQHVL